MGKMDIVDKAIGIMIMASLIPAALETYHSANTTGFTTTELALWGLVGVLVIVGVIKKVTD